jgi:hypothetical protein
MHLKLEGPFWWGEEVLAGLEMCWLMVKQPGFLMVALYSAWAYAQYTLIMVLIGALTSTVHKYRPFWVGLCASSLAGGASMAIPFQKASIFSRARKQKARSDSMTFQQSKFWSSHSTRRLIFTIVAPLGAVGFACSTWSPRNPVAVPCILAGVVGYATNLAIAECYGLIMETFDTSDLQPGMTGRLPRKSVTRRNLKQRTNFTCYPRVSAGMAVTQSLAFALAGASTAMGGRMERRLGITEASGVVAGILLVITGLLAIVLVRWRSVPILPSAPKFVDPHDRRTTMWEPVILGNPSGTTRKINILESGRQTRFSEIRRRNRVNSGFVGR